MKNNDNNIMAKVLFLAILLLESIEDLSETNKYLGVIKSRCTALLRILHHLVGGTFKELKKINEDGSHNDVYQKLSEEFDLFYNNFIQKLYEEKEFSNNP